MECGKLWVSQTRFRQRITVNPNLFRGSLEMWADLDRQYAKRFGKVRRGPYGWTYPTIKSDDGQPIKRPTFKDLMEDVDPNSPFSQIYYGVSTSKTHGEMVWNPLMVFPDAREFRFHSFSGEGIGLVLNLTLPLYEEVIDNTESRCRVSQHGLVRSVARAIVEDLRDSITQITASNPDAYLSAPNRQRGVV